MSEQLETENHEEVVIEAPAESFVPPGAQLKAARESMGLSLADVSHALKFSVRQIDALEQDDFSGLNGHTFLRGFVRSYARFLKLDETPLLAALQQEVPTPVVEVREVESMNAAMPAQTSSITFQPLRKALTLAVVACILGAVGWGVMRSDLLPKSGLQSLDQPVSVAVDVKPATEAVVAPAVPQEGGLVLAPPATTVMPAAGAEVPTPAAPAPLPADERVLSFSFADQSWVEVKDARQNIVLTGKFSAGMQQVARGKPPFQVVVGNASAVKLRYDDRMIDLQPFIRAEVARLTLDDNSK